MSTVKTKLGASFIALALTLAGVGTLASAGPALAKSKKEAKHKKHKKKSYKKSYSKGQSQNQKAHNETEQNSSQEIDNETRQSNDVDQGGTQRQGSIFQVGNGNNFGGNNVCPTVNAPVVVGGIFVPVLAPGAGQADAVDANNDPDTACNAAGAGGDTGAAPVQNDNDVAAPVNTDGDDNNAAVNAPVDGPDNASNAAQNNNTETDIDMEN